MQSGPLDYIWGWIGKALTPMVFRMLYLLHRAGKDCPILSIFLLLDVFLQSRGPPRVVQDRKVIKKIIIKLVKP